MCMRCLVVVVVAACPVLCLLLSESMCACVPVRSYRLFSRTAFCCAGTGRVWSMCLCVYGVGVCTLRLRILRRAIFTLTVQHSLHFTFGSGPPNPEGGASNAFFTSRKKKSETESQGTDFTSSEEPVLVCANILCTALFCCVVHVS